MGRKPLDQRTVAQLPNVEKVALDQMAATECNGNRSEMIRVLVREGAIRRGVLKAKAVSVEAYELIGG